MSYQRDLRAAALAFQNQHYCQVIALLTAHPQESASNLLSLELLAQAYYNLGDFELAKTFFLRMLDLQNSSAFYHYLALCHYHQGDQQAAADTFRKAVQAPEPYGESYYLLAILEQQAGRLEHAQEHARALLKIQSSHAGARFLLADCYEQQQNHTEALKEYHLVLQQDHRRELCAAALGRIYKGLGDYQQANDYLKLAFQLAPNAENQNNWASHLHSSGETQAAARLYHSGLETIANTHYWEKCQTWAAKMMSLYASSTITNHDLKQEIQAFASYFESTLPLTPTSPSKRFIPGSTQAVKRIGYVTPDARNHSAGRLLYEYLKHHNKDFEIHVFALPGTQDRMTQELKKLSDHWHELHAKDVLTNDQLIRQQGIDILIDMAGFSSDSILPLFARRPARLQLTGLGLPLPTTLKAFDGFISDAICQQYAAFTGEPAFLIPSWICWQNRDLSVDRQLDSHLSPESIVLGSPHALAKLNPDLLNCWAQILQDHPESSLLLKAPGLNDLSIRERLLQAFKGIEPHRLILEAGSSYLDYLRFYNRIDLVLDSFPYPGGTTSCEALGMGVPVMTMPARHAGGTSLVSQVGHPDWSGKTIQDYVQNISKQIKQGSWTKKQRQEIASAFNASYAGRPADCVAGFEEALQKIC